MENHELKLNFTEKSWLPQAGALLETTEFDALQSFLSEEAAAGKTIYPPQQQIFAAFEHTPYDQLKVVLLGQDPYINSGQACGLSFSVPKGEKIPPSLKNMYKELAENFEDFDIPDHGDISSWADQGVLLLNSVLTVEEGQSGSHAKQGWEKFTDGIIKLLNDHPDELIFLLWGGYAKKKGKLIDRDKHHVLETGHPSPLSIRYFRGCQHFSKTNALLEKMGKTPINWQV